MPLKLTKDGRTIRTDKAYTEFRLALYLEQNGLCCECGRLCYLSSPLEWDDSFHVAHRGTRGIGGCWRDDVVGPNKGQVEGGKCGFDHRREHNERNHPSATNTEQPNSKRLPGGIGGAPEEVPRPEEVTVSGVRPSGNDRDIV